MYRRPRHIRQRFSLPRCRGRRQRHLVFTMQQQVGLRTSVYRVYTFLLLIRHFYYFLFCQCFVAFVNLSQGFRMKSYRLVHLLPRPGAATGTDKWTIDV